MRVEPWTYLAVALGLFVADWVLGVARIHWPAFLPLFFLVNFPAGIAFLWLERRDTLWWHERLGWAINDEVGQSIAFLGMVAVQAALYAGLFTVYSRRRPRTRGISAQRTGI